MTRLAFLGLGAMGSPMAERLSDAGHELRVWNRSRDKAEPFAGRARIAEITRRPPAPLTGSP